MNMCTLSAEKPRNALPPENSMHVKCNLCRADDYTVVYRAGEAQVNQIVRCNRCELMYVNPITIPPRGNRPSARNAGVPAGDSFISSHTFRLEKELLQVRDYRNTRSFLRTAMPALGRLVEVGSGTGSLLNAFQKDGWQVEGVDPWTEGCEYARTHYGITAHPKTLTEVGYPDASIDVVLMIHVIEHLIDPASELKEIHRILRPNGALVVETPRYDSVMFRLLGKRERSISHGGHVFFFTTRTLRGLAEKAGFRVERTTYVGRSLNVKRLVWNLGVMCKSARLQHVLVGLAGRLGLDRVQVYVNARDMQRVLFAKTEPPNHAMPSPAQSFEAPGA